MSNCWRTPSVLMVLVSPSEMTLNLTAMHICIRCQCDAVPLVVIPVSHLGYGVTRVWLMWEYKTMKNHYANEKISHHFTCTVILSRHMVVNYCNCGGCSSCQCLPKHRSRHLDVQWWGFMWTEMYFGLFIVDNVMVLTIEPILSVGWYYRHDISM